MISDFRPDGDAPRYFGVYPAIVTDIVDPERLGRVEVKFPWLGTEGERDVRAWATMVSPYADQDQGFQVLPEVDSQVVVAFEMGDLRRPYVMGSTWNGREALPEEPREANNKRLIRTRSASVLEFDDTEGSPKITLSTQAGHKLELNEGTSEVTLTHQNGSLIKFDSAGNVTITAVSGATINAPSGLTVNAPTSTFSGAVICQPLTATSVTSPVYSPGAGNVW